MAALVDIQSAIHPDLSPRFLILNQELYSLDEPRKQFLINVRQCCIQAYTEDDVPNHHGEATLIQAVVSICRFQIHRLIDASLLNR